MNTVNQELLYKAIGEIVNRIEACGASPELTNAVMLASDLQRAVGNMYNQPDQYSLLRVIEAMNSKEKLYQGCAHAETGLCDKCVKEVDRF